LLTGCGLPNFPHGALAILVISCRCREKSVYASYTLAVLLAIHSAWQHRTILESIRQAEGPNGYNLNVGIVVNGLIGLLGFALGPHLARGFLQRTSLGLVNQAGPWCADVTACMARHALNPMIVLRVGSLFSQSDFRE
jgi:hypothetical protein